MYCLFLNHRQGPIPTGFKPTSASPAIRTNGPRSTAGRCRAAETAWNVRADGHNSRWRCRRICCGKRCELCRPTLSCFCCNDYLSTDMTWWQPSLDLLISWFYQFILQFCNNFKKYINLSLCYNWKYYVERDTQLDMQWLAVWAAGTSRRWRRWNSNKRINSLNSIRTAAHANLKWNSS